MAKQKKFDIVNYILKKHNIQGKIVDYRFGSLGNLQVRLEMDYDMFMPVMVNDGYITEGDLEFEYYTITNGNKFLINPDSIEIPSIDWNGVPYYIACDSINKKPGKNYQHQVEDDVIIVLDKKIVLIERWVEYVEYDSVTKVLELGTLTEDDWNKLQVLGKAKTVITEPEEQDFYKKICEKNNK